MVSCTGLHRVLVRWNPSSVGFYVSLMGNTLRNMSPLEKACSLSWGSIIWMVRYAKKSRLERSVLVKHENAYYGWRAALKNSSCEGEEHCMHPNGERRWNAAATYRVQKGCKKVKVVRGDCENGAQLMAPCQGTPIVAKPKK